MIKELLFAIVKCSLLLQKIGMWVTIRETNIFAPENGWLGDDPFLFGFRPIFTGKLLGLGRGTRTHHTDFLAYSMQPLLPSTIHCQAAQRKNITFPPVGKRHFFQPTPNSLMSFADWILVVPNFPTRLVSFWRCILLKVVWFISFKSRKHIYLLRQIFLYHSKTWIFGGDSLTNNHLGWRVLGLLWLSSCFYQQPQLARPSLTHRSLSERAIFFAGAWHVTRFGGV